MYQALYRKYRPQDFDQLLGQDHINRILKNQVKSGNIGHAYLFSGTRGTGKTSAAKIFSRAVNCLQPEDGNPCNKCANCLEIIEENTLDVIEMDAASHRGIDDIRELRDKVIFSPANIKYKVYIVDEVHMLTDPAFNALLKTLEEPPAHLIFILATTEPDRLPQTILSRCQRFDFRRISTDHIRENIKMILGDLNMEAEEEAIDLIARNSDGAMRDALSLLDQCVSLSEDKISYQDALDILGISNQDFLFNLVDQLKEKNLDQALLALDEIIEAGKDLKQLTKDLILHFRNLMIVKSSKDPATTEDLGYQDQYRQQVQDMDLDFILTALDILSQAESQGQWSGQMRIILEMALIKITRLEWNLSLIERLERLEEGYLVRDQSPSAEKKKPVKDSARAVIKEVVKREEKEVQEKKPETKETLSQKEEVLISSGQISLEIISKEWENVLRRVRTKDVKSYAFLKEASLRSYLDNLLTISYKKDFAFHQEAISAEDRKLVVEDALTEHFKEDIKILATLGLVNQQVVKEENTSDKDSAIEAVKNLLGDDLVEVK